MGWRKLTIQDGDLARCCAAQGPPFARPASRFVFMRQPQHHHRSQTVANSRRLGQLSPGQSGPRMWSSTLQRSARLGCRTALSKLRGTSRPVPMQAHPPGIVHRLCYCHFN